MLMLSSLFLAGFLLLTTFAWRKRHPAWGVTYLGVGVALSLYYESVKDWIDGLGSDSLSEARYFAWKEAWFFLGTLSTILKPLAWKDYLQTLGLALAISLVCLVYLGRFAGAPRFFGEHNAIQTAPTSWIRRAALACILIPSLAQSAELYLRFISTSNIYERVSTHFHHPDLVVRTSQIGSHDMRVVVYIGESTTSLHWNLYGYPRDTTPELNAFAAQDTGLLTFRHVVSTYTHTSASLLEALSFAIDTDGDYQTIDEKRRIALTEVLKQLSIPTLLLSNQGPTGTFNLASQAIFNQVTRAEYPRDAALLGNQAWRVAQPEDKYFQSALDAFRHFSPQSPAVLFLHSYAGHGNYLRNIPEWARQSVDRRLDGATLSAILGSRWTDERLLAENVQGYDSAMRYVTLSITKVLEQVAATAEPTAFLYFSDHGESPYANAAHDVSRYQHEMSRVPFLMYFNQAARTADPALFRAFRQASRNPQTSTLAQVPGTIMTLLGYRTQGLGHDYRGIGLDAAHTLSPILVREAGETIQYTRSHGAARDIRAQALDNTDAVTTLWLNSRGGGNDPEVPRVCYDQANTWAKAIRGSAVADCLAVKLALPDTGLDAAPALKDSRGWVLQAVADASSRRGLLLRLDGSALPPSLTCAAVQDWLSKQPTGAAKRITLILQTGVQHDPQAIAQLDPKPATHGAFTSEYSALAAVDAPAMPRTAGDETAFALAAADTPGLSALPAACGALQAVGVTLSLHVPETLLDDDRRFSAWQTVARNAGWPTHYSLPQPPATDVWRVLSGIPNARWDLENVSVTDLPWQDHHPEFSQSANWYAQSFSNERTRLAGDERTESTNNGPLLQPISLTVLTDWDVNSR